MILELGSLEKRWADGVSVSGIESGVGIRLEVRVLLQKGGGKGSTLVFVREWRMG